MGNDFEKNEKYNMTKFIDINIQLSKICFFPGEKINGVLNIVSKSGSQYSIMTNPQINFTITQFDHYHYTAGGRGRGKTERIVQEEELPLLVTVLDFPKVSGKNILHGVQIPFTIQIPINARPTLIFSSTAFTKHILTVFIPILQTKKSVLIIIKNSQFFSNANRLYESPSMRGKYIAKTKCYCFQIGKINFQLRTPKNAYSYDEIIPFQVVIDSNQLNTGINGVIISIEREERQNLKNNHLKTKFNNKEKLISQFYQLNSQQKINQFNGEIKFPNLVDEVYPPKMYKLCDLHQPSEIIKLIDSIHLAPSSFYGLLSVQYLLKAKISFDSSLTTDEKIELPIDFYCFNEGINNSLFKKQKLIDH